MSSRETIIKDIINKKKKITKQKFYKFKLFKQFTYINI